MEYEKRQSIYKTIMLLILVAIISFITATVIAYNKFGAQQKTKYVVVGNNSTSDTFTRLKNVVDKYYLGEYDEEKMKTEAARGYIEGLGDDYSEYIPKEEYEEFYEDMVGSLVGIGIYFGKTMNDDILIIAPIENSAAEKAGIESGDIIKKVNDFEVTKDTTSDEVSQQIKGDVGTTITMEVLRGEEIKTFEIMRENVKLHYVKTKMLEGNIGYIRLLSFDENTADEFKEKLEELISDGAKSLIIDLRNNGGGIVQEAIKIADYFLDKGTKIITIKDKNGGEQESIASQDKITDMKIKILVNEYTASASEILASALKENERAELIGIKTYGKGVIQSVFNLTDGSALKLTTNEYYTAGGNKLNKIGIEPNYEVKLPEDAYIFNVKEEQDTQLKKAIELLK